MEDQNILWEKCYVVIFYNFLNIYTVIYFYAMNEVNDFISTTELNPCYEIALICKQLLYLC